MSYLRRVTFHLYCSAWDWNQSQWPRSGKHPYQEISSGLRPGPSTKPKCWDFFEDWTGDRVQIPTHGTEAHYYHRTRGPSTADLCGLVGNHPVQDTLPLLPSISHTQLIPKRWSNRFASLFWSHSNIFLKGRVIKYSFWSKISIFIWSRNTHSTSLWSTCGIRHDTLHSYFNVHCNYSDKCIPSEIPGVEVLPGRRKKVGGRISDWL